MREQRTREFYYRIWHHIGNNNNLQGTSDHKNERVLSQKSLKPCAISEQNDLIWLP